MFSKHAFKHILKYHLRCQRRLLFNDSGLGSKKGKKFSNTLNLPKTSFQLSMKDIAVREQELYSLCGFESLYSWQRKNNNGQEFILHDGPPYANGKPHVGHAINKILKDIVNRYHVMQGDLVHYVPGWDCHGLPIEMKALKERAHEKLTPLQIRDKARRFARQAVQQQMAGFQRWGVMADWENQTYFTDNPAYEATQLEVFYQLYNKGYVYRDVMPVYWSPSSRTALAESELEYNNEHVSTAIYVKVPLVQKPQRIHDASGSLPVYGVIWTTTPWTLPANQAIAYSDKISYALLKSDAGDECYLCEADFADKLASITGMKLTAVSTIPGSELSGSKYRHPLTNEELPFLPGSHVTANKGTGLVHTAPSHGQEDFQLAKKYNIKPKVLLDEQCCFTEEAGTDLHTKPVNKETENAVISLLGEHVLHQEQFAHSYPYDWRTKQPVIVRTSRQWFIDTEAIRQPALDCLKSVKIYPGRLWPVMEDMLHKRTYWCISRQRLWGLPIPVFYNIHTGQPLITRETIDHLKTLVSEHGSDCWWSLEHQDLLPDSLLTQCGLGISSDYVKGGDILDIWFDSGSSWKAVLGAGNEADVYMEGIDQFGGWFQSSLLLSVALQNKAPYKSLVVHGFTVDEEGKKMSKSLGNVVDPETIINGGKNRKKEPVFGADVLRWWAAFSNLQDKSTIGTEKLTAMKNDVYEIRKMLRYLLGMVSCEGSRTLTEYDQLWPQDQYMLYQLYNMASEIPALYKSYQYVKLLNTIDAFLKKDVSKFYTTIVKDRCYCDISSSPGRQSSLTTQFHVLDVVTRALAPILPYLAEDIYFNYPSARRKKDVDSVFKSGWYELQREWNNPDIEYTVEPALDIRDHLLDIIGDEPAAEFDVILYTSKLLHTQLQKLQTEGTSSHSPLCEILQVSSTTLTEQPLSVIPDDVQAVSGICNVHLTDGYKNPEKYMLILKDTDKFICERCRRFTAVTANTLCPRCLDALATGWE